MDNNLPVAARRGAAGCGGPPECDMNVTSVDHSVCDGGLGYAYPLSATCRGGRRGSDGGSIK